MSEHRSQRQRARQTSCRSGGRLPALLCCLALTLLTAGIGGSAAASPATGRDLPRAATTPATLARPLAAANPASPVTVTLDSLSPRSPDARKLSQPVTVVATISNTTDSTYSGVQFSIERGEPITQQHLLDQAITTPPDTYLDVLPPLPLTKPLLPHSQQTVVYKTAPVDLCLCYDGVYSYALVVKAPIVDQGSLIELGRAQMFVPSFQTAPKKPVTVGWVWPLLDRPHRAIDDTVFTDDQLAAEISPGGRLDRALKVAELVAGKVRLALLVDPELLDSLAVMASPAGYRVKSGVGTVAGTGGALAASWLARLKAVRGQHDLVLTAYADPDVNAVARAGLKWSTALDQQVQSRISPTLDGDFSSDLLTWPIGGALTNRALDALVGGGASTVLLSDSSLPGQNSADPKPDAISPLPSAAGQAVALVTDSPIEATVGRIMKLGANAAADQQLLLAQLAIRAEQDPSAGHFVVITPPRYVDADPQVAAATITSVLGTDWSAPVSLRTALSTVRPVDRGALQVTAENPSAELNPDNVAQLSAIEQQVASLNDALHDNDAAAQLLAGFTNGIRRAEASGWRTDPAGGGALVRSLQSRIDALTGSVHLVRPAVGTYSLSSSDSPVVVTVSNQLPRPVTVLVSVTPAP
ncbi:MAG TPA: hypothetical protein VFD94_10175, partial [Jatrophihabitans sp.]|nr:hypothetical protein [Jatrophihabitans sp.]